MAFCVVYFYAHVQEVGVGVGKYAAFGVGRVASQWGCQGPCSRLWPWPRPWLRPCFSDPAHRTAHNLHEKWLLFFFSSWFWNTRKMSSLLSGNTEPIICSYVSPLDDISQDELETLNPVIRNWNGSSYEIFHLPPLWRGDSLLWVSPGHRPCYRITLTSFGMNPGTE